MRQSDNFPVLREKLSIRTLALALVGGMMSIGLMTSARAAEPSPLNVGAAKIEITPRTLNGLNPMPGEFTGVQDQSMYGPSLFATPTRRSLSWWGI